MDTIILYIFSHWVEWLFAAVSALLGLCYKQLAKQMKENTELFSVLLGE